MTGFKVGAHTHLAQILLALSIILVFFTKWQTTNQIIHLYLRQTNINVKPEIEAKRFFVTECEIGEQGGGGANNWTPMKLHLLTTREDPFSFH